jgi:hypothetical protein
MSLGYMLLFGRTMFAALASLGMATVRQKLDPASLLEYWENERGERSITDERDKNLESMFG